jgi:nucleotide-binding universal stress UspA family protein
VKALVPYDGSPEAGRAVDVVVRMAFPSATVLGVGPAAEVRRGRRRRGRPFSDRPGFATSDELARATERLKAAGVAAEQVERSGNVTKAILETAAAGDFDLIVIGSQKRHPLTRFLFGSTAERVVRKAPVDFVVVVR